MRKNLNVTFYKQLYNIVGKEQALVYIGTMQYILCSCMCIYYVTIKEAKQWVNNYISCFNYDTLYHIIPLDDLKFVKILLSFLLTRRSGLKSPRDLNIWLISLPVWSTDNSCSNTFPWMYTSFGRVNTFGKPSAKDYHQLTTLVSKCPRKRVLKIAAYSAECEGFKVRISKCTVKLFFKKNHMKAIFVNCDTDIILPAFCIFVRVVVFLGGWGAGIRWSWRKKGGFGLGTPKILWKDSIYTSKQS